MNDLIANFAIAAHNANVLKKAQDTINSFIEDKNTKVWIEHEDGRVEMLNGNIKFGHYTIIPIEKEGVYEDEKQKK